ncbi:hypothetical protein BVH03_21880 [Pseudomonas sp. PA15(2017)]|uniref:hypothetical protein n=1 Tax=Pseudomonas sp. PA15(2017) TaxID=1932111 RepID=UPI00095C8BC5|nr:hypothetical protein [Pseudomonas sp. PA15(2017)]OLU22905.1 hypothetical protein BVH03_21880 [Pseudomonas sp. PA15(2017)]
MSHDTLNILGFRHELQLFDRRTGELVHREVKHNRIPQAGLDFLAQAPFGDVASIPAFYCGLFTKNFLASANTSAADIPAIMGEFLDYSEPTRPEWLRSYNDGTYDNLASKAVFTPTKDATVYGSFIVSNQTKGANSGLLLSVVRFSTAKQLSVDLDAKLVCGITYIPTN